MAFVSIIATSSSSTSSFQLEHHYHHRQQQQQQQQQRRPALVCPSFLHSSVHYFYLPFQKTQSQQQQGPYLYPRHLSYSYCNQNYHFKKIPSLAFSSHECTLHTSTSTSLVRRSLSSSSLSFIVKTNTTNRNNITTTPITINTINHHHYRKYNHNYNNMNKTIKQTFSTSTSTSTSTKPTSKNSIQMLSSDNPSSPSSSNIQSFGQYFTQIFTKSFPSVACRLQPHQISTAANLYLFRFDKRLSQPFIHRLIDNVASTIQSVNHVSNEEAHRIFRTCARDASRAYFANGWHDVNHFVEANTPHLLNLVARNDRHTAVVQQQQLYKKNKHSTNDNDDDDDDDDISVLEVDPAQLNAMLRLQHQHHDELHHHHQQQQQLQQLQLQQYENDNEDVNDEEYQQLQQQQKHEFERTSIVVFVYANYCSQCKRVRPIFEQAARIHQQQQQQKLDSTTQHQQQSHISPSESTAISSQPPPLYVSLNGPNFPEFRHQFNVNAYPTILRYDPPSSSSSSTIPPPSSTTTYANAAPTSIVPRHDDDITDPHRFPSNVRHSVSRIVAFANGVDLISSSATTPDMNLGDSPRNEEAVDLDDVDVDTKLQHYHHGHRDGKSTSFISPQPNNTSLQPPASPTPLPLPPPAKPKSGQKQNNYSWSDRSRSTNTNQQNVVPPSPPLQPQKQRTPSQSPLSPSKLTSPRSQWMALLRRQGIDELDKLSNERQKMVNRKIDRAIQCDASSCSIGPERSLPARRNMRKVARDWDDVHNFPPLCVLVGGGMGAGKTTVINLVEATPFWKAHGDSTIIVEADAFKMCDPLFHILRGVTPNAASLVHGDSLKAAEELFVQAVNSRRDIVFDGTMAWLEYAKQTIEMLRDTDYVYRRGRGVVRGGGKNGEDLEEYWVRDHKRSFSVVPYRVEVVGVTAEPDISVMRGIVRRITSGRDVSIRQQLNSHRLFSTNFEHYARLVDACYLFDTTLPSVTEEDKLNYVGQLIALKPGLLFKTPRDVDEFISDDDDDGVDDDVDVDAMDVDEIMEQENGGLEEDEEQRQKQQDEHEEYDDDDDDDIVIPKKEKKVGGLTSNLSYGQLDVDLDVDVDVRKTNSLAGSSYASLSHVITTTEDGLIIRFDEAYKKFIRKKWLNVGARGAQQLYKGVEENGETS